MEQKQVTVCCCLPSSHFQVIIPQHSPAYLLRPTFTNLEVLWLS